MVFDRVFQYQTFLKLQQANSLLLQSFSVFCYLF